jgi:Domain of unknown function (DUF4440)
MNTMSSLVRRLLPSTLVLCGMAATVSAQSAPADPAAAVLDRDRLFWKAYNACDVKGMGEFFAEDVEFYHDKGGITLGHASLVGTIKTNLCSNPDSRLRREAVEGTIKFYPLSGGGAVYGGILSGEHLFYVLEKGKPDRLDGRARFTHLWLLRDGAWRMSRILSFDHGPANR